MRQQKDLGRILDLLPSEDAIREDHAGDGALIEKKIESRTLLVKYVTDMEQEFSKFRVNVLDTFTCMNIVKESLGATWGVCQAGGWKDAVVYGMAKVKVDALRKQLAELMEHAATLKIAGESVP